MISGISELLPPFDIDHLEIVNCSKAMFTLFLIVRRSVVESVRDMASVHTRNAAFEAVSVPEQYCSAPLLKVERSVSDRFLKRSESNLKLQLNLLLVNDLFKSKESVVNCMTDRASVHTGNASEQFLHRNRTLVTLFRATFETEPKTYPAQCEHSLI